MREKFIRFMNGRNGMDELARAESWVVMILLLVSIFTRSAILDILAMVVPVRDSILQDCVQVESC